MLDLISFHFALYAQWITSVQQAHSVWSPGQGANLFCHHVLTWLYLIYLWSHETCKLTASLGSCYWWWGKGFPRTPSWSASPHWLSRGRSGYPGSSLCEVQCLQRPCPTAPMETSNGTRVFGCIWLHLAATNSVSLSKLISHSKNLSVAHLSWVWQSSSSTYTHLFTHSKPITVPKVGWSGI